MYKDRAGAVCFLAASLEGRSFDRSFLRIEIGLYQKKTTKTLIQPGFHPPGDFVGIFYHIKVNHNEAGFKIEICPGNNQMKRRRAMTQLENRVVNYWAGRACDFGRVRERELHNELGRRWRAAILKQLPDRNNLKILDVGTGTGFFRSCCQKKATSLPVST